MYYYVQQLKNLKKYAKLNYQSKSNMFFFTTFKITYSTCTNALGKELLGLSII